MQASQYFFNTSIEYFDRLANIERYTYFGTFRSSVSNVGPNSALLNQNGGLTYIGAWYLNKDQSMASSITGSGSAGTAKQVGLVSVAIGCLVGVLGGMIL